MNEFRVHQIQWSHLFVDEIDSTSPLRCTTAPKKKGLGPKIRITPARSIDFYRTFEFSLGQGEGAVQLRTPEYVRTNRNNLRPPSTILKTSRNVQVTSLTNQTNQHFTLTSLRFHFFNLQPHSRLSFTQSYFKIPFSVRGTDVGKKKVFIVPRIHCSSPPPISFALRYQIAISINFGITKDRIQKMARK